MIGERRREIDVTVLQFYQIFKLAELSDAAGLGERKNVQFPVSCPQAAPPRRGSAIGRMAKLHRGYMGSEKSVYYRRRPAPFGLYLASRVSGRGPAGLGKSRAARRQPAALGRPIPGGRDPGLAASNLKCQSEVTVPTSIYDKHAEHGPVNILSC